MVYPIRAKQFNSREGWQKTVTIPSASVLTLSTVGYVLIAASSDAQRAIVPVEIFAKISAGTAYASVNNMNILYGTVGGTTGATIATIVGAGFLDQTAAKGVQVAPFSASTGVIVSPGLPVSIQMATGDPTTGTSAMVVRIRYKIHRVS